MNRTFDQAKNLILVSNKVALSPVIQGIDHVKYIVCNMTRKLYKWLKEQLQGDFYCDIYHQDGHWYVELQTWESIAEEEFQASGLTREEYAKDVYRDMMQEMDAARYIGLC